MTSDISFPKLRHPIEIRLQKIENEEIILINCPLGISKTPLALIPAIGPVLASFEGVLSRQEILDKFSSYGLTSELLQTLITLLDENLYLATPKFFEAQNKGIQDFKDSKNRPASLAGRAYSNKGVELRGEIDRYLKYGDQPKTTDGRALCGLVSPHIDYNRGQITYGKTYNRLKEHEPDLYILIGTSHQYSKNIFHLSAKHFESPLGTLNCNVDFMLKLAELYGIDRSFEEEILHKQEHSLELQLPFIKRLKDAPKIAPILVGSFHHILQSGKLPAAFEEYDKFTDSLCQCLKEFISQGGKPCIVAGVDMAHVGKYFGDSTQLNPEYMQLIQAKDLKYLECIQKQDKKTLFEDVAEDLDARRICGFPTMYTVIDCFDRLGVKYSAELFEYRQAVNYDTDCAVTFAGMGIYRPV
jgi:AmmeMemoRadiSam system protein B